MRDRLRVNCFLSHGALDILIIATHVSVLLTLGDDHVLNYSPVIIAMNTPYEER